MRIRGVEITHQILLGRTDPKAAGAGSIPQDRRSIQHQEAYLQPQSTYSGKEFYCLSAALCVSFQTTKRIIRGKPGSSKIPYQRCVNKDFAGLKAAREIRAGSPSVGGSRTDAGPRQPSWTQATQRGGPQHAASGARNWRTARDTR